MSDVVDQIVTLFADKGGAQYAEQVSQTEHALQAALAARDDEAPDSLVAAALLHDIGHLLVNESAREDRRHEHVGAGWLARSFGPAVCEPVRLHVAAKRYLVAVEPEYRARLSGASIHSLELQGGAMDAAEMKAFRGSDLADQAVRLRRYDEAAKVVGLDLPSFESFASLLEEQVRPTL